MKLYRKNKIKDNIKLNNEYNGIGSYPYFLLYSRFNKFILIKNIKIIVLNYFFIIFLLLFNKNYILK